MLTRTRIKWLVAALIASLSLNIAAIGFYIGRSARESHTSLLVPTLMPTHTIALQSLPEQRARAILSQLNESIQPARQDMSRMREVRGELHRLLVSEPFNHEAFAQKLDELTESVTRVHGHTNSSFVKITMHMTPAERRIVGRHIERPRSFRTIVPMWMEREIGQELGPPGP
ncbi:MAG: periplasmic heavy metal sensor [Gammaproteobacteria bacterium]|nr:periplasmic heavy metal sensor [Gammaproteobacteria bacterium]